MNIKKDFPIFNNKPLVYFDNAATTQKPTQVIDSIVEFYTKHNSNIHRGIYSFGEYATVLFEKSRTQVANFINAHVSEVIFTNGTTGSINFVALSWADKFIKAGDEIIISAMEHHSNMLPWQQIAQKKAAVLKIIPVTTGYELDMQAYEQLLTPNTKLVAITHISNVLGTLNDIELITQKAHVVGAKVLIDAAQSVAHCKIDVKKINCDFLAFSGHKLLGPTGIGILYIKNILHNQIEPLQLGGGMVFEANIANPTWLQSPHKFEAGTPPVAQAIGLASAIDYIKTHINFDHLQKHEAALCSRLIDGLLKYPEIKILGPIEQLKQKGHIVSFTIANFHPHDVAAYLDTFGICVRAGHHCAQPLHKALGIESSIRVSFYGYNTLQEIEFLLEKIEQLLISTL
ncbi:MAG: cysteine desulfurase [Candidatus Babeliales bacterium]|nr:cysteine desulfurase [Candidatus Babeliales bacterium]